MEPELAEPFVELAGQVGQRLGKSVDLDSRFHAQEARDEGHRGASGWRAVFEVPPIGPRDDAECDAHAR